MTVFQPENVSTLQNCTTMQAWQPNTNLPKLFMVKFNNTTEYPHRCSAYTIPWSLNHLDLHLTRQNKLNDIKDIAMTTVHQTLYSCTILLNVGAFTINATLNGTYQILHLIQTCRDWTLPTYKGWNSKQFWWNHIYIKFYPVSIVACLPNYFCKQNY